MERQRTDLLMPEFGPWQGLRMGWFGWAAGIAAAVGLVFFAVGMT